VEWLSGCEVLGKRALVRALLKSIDEVVRGGYYESSGISFNYSLTFIGLSLTYPHVEVVEEEPFELSPGDDVFKVEISIAPLMFRGARVGVHIKLEYSMTMVDEDVRRALEYISKLLLAVENVRTRAGELLEAKD